MPLAEYQTVRIKTLFREGDADHPFGEYQRLPHVGDIGTIIDISEPTEGQTTYTVEHGGPDGRPIWIANFVEEELEAIHAKARQPEGRTEKEPGQFSDPASSAADDASAGGQVGAGWRTNTVVAIGVVLFFVLEVAAVAAAFFLWPPASAIGSGLRTATVMVTLVVAGVPMSIAS